MEAVKKKYLEGKAREFESNYAGDHKGARDGARQPVVSMLERIIFDRMKFFEVCSLDRQSFFLDVMLHICEGQRGREDRFHDGINDLKNAIAVAQMVVGDLRKKLTQVEHVGELAEGEMEGFYCSLEQACDNLNRSEMETNFDRPAMKPYFSKANWLCYVAGLKVDFLHSVDFDGIPNHCADHLSTEEWICNFLEENYKSEREQEPEGNPPSSKETLERMGFRTDVANAIVERASTTEKHLLTSHWAEMYIRDEFKYNPVLSGVIRHEKFPFSPFTRGEWQILHMKKVGGGANSDREVNVLNLERSRLKRTSYPEQSGCRSFPRDLEDETHRVLFHGTDHESAENILFRGVQITQGRKNRDFSSGSGFYLTGDFQHAVEWAFSCTRKPVVLVYRVERSLLESFSGYSLVGKGKANEWADVVKQYRSGKPSKKLRKMIRNYDFIEGPRSYSCDQTSPEPMEDTYQMCVVSSKFAEALDGSLLHSAVFYDDSTNKSY